MDKVLQNIYLLSEQRQAGMAQEQPESVVANLGC